MSDLFTQDAYGGVHPAAPKPERPHGIGASDSPAACGVSPWKTPWQLCLEKLGALGPSPTTGPQLRGLLLEPLVFRLYEEATGEELREVPIVRHPMIPWMFCSPDRETGSGQLVEGKTTSEYQDGWGTPGTDEIPDAYLIQGHHQMECRRTEAVDFPVLFVNGHLDKALSESGSDRAAARFLQAVMDSAAGGRLEDMLAILGWRFAIYRVPRSERLTRQVLELEREFWGCVERREPPPPDYKNRACQETLKAMYGVEDYEVPLDQFEHAAAAYDYVQAGLLISGATKMKEAARARLLHALEDAARGRLPDGTLVSRRVVKRKGYEVEACEYTTLTVKGPRDEDRDESR